MFFGQETFKTYERNTNIIKAIKNRINKNAKGEAFIKPYFVATKPLPYNVINKNGNKKFE